MAQKVTITNSGSSFSTFENIPDLEYFSHCADDTYDIFQKLNSDAANNALNHSKKIISTLQDNAEVMIIKSVSISVDYHD